MKSILEQGRTKQIMSESVQLLKELVEIPSINPHLNEEGIDEKAVADFAYKKLDSYGFDVKLQPVKSGGRYYKFQPDKPMAERCSVIARFGKSKGKKLVLNGHLDTVGTTNIQNLTPATKKQLLTGRGSADMKAGLAAMIAAARIVKESNINIDGSVILTLVVDEETWGTGTRTFAENERVDYAVVCEPTNLKISLSQAGYLDFNIFGEGESQHGSTITIGQPISAVLNVARLCAGIAELPILRKPVTYDHVAMENTMNVAPIPAPVHSSFAWMSHEVYGMNVLLGIAPRKTRAESAKAIDEILERVEQLVKKSNSRGEHNRVDVNYKLHGFIQSKNKFTSTFSSAVRNVMGKAEYSHTLSFCDGTFLHDRDVSTLLFGPGRMEVGHSSHEYVELTQVKLAAAVYAQLILDVLS